MTTPARRRWQWAGLARQAGLHAALSIAVLVSVFPFYWMFVTAVRPSSEVFATSFHWLPGTFVPWDNFRMAITQAPLLRFMLNGFIVCAGILLVQLLVSIPAAYALAKYDFRGKRAFFSLVLFGLCVPIQVTALPLYLGLAHFDVLDTYFALMLPFFLSVFGIFLFRQYFKAFPDDIIDAGRIDGFSEAGILWRLVVPAAKPAIAAFAVFSVTAHWNDLYWPLIVVTSADMAPPSLGVMYFNDDNANQNFAALMAAATLVTAPLLIAFLVAQRQFIQGITMTGLK